MPLYKFDIFTSTVCFRLINFSFTYSLFCSRNFDWLNVLHFSDYLHLFDLDSATIEIWPASFHLIDLSTLHQTMVYAVQIQNNLLFLVESFILSLIISEVLLMSTLLSYNFSKGANLFEILT